MAIVSAQRQLIYEEDVQFSASVSEAVGNKLASTLNFVNTRITKDLHFGVGGAVYSGLSGYPYTFANNSEVAAENLLIQRIVVANKVSGTSGDTVFYLEKRPYLSGTWTTMFSTNCTINHAASDDIIFASNESAPSGVTLPVLNTTTINYGDEIRFVLFSAAADAANLLVTIEASPV